RSGAHAAVIADYRRRIEAAGPYQDVALRKKHREPKTIGRAHKKGYLAHGFSCGDETIITPHMGPCSGEYHIASDLYPTERKLTPVSESRRIYFHNKYFATQADDGFGMDHFPKLYTPNSSYVNIDTGEWAHDEVALRHLAAFIYYTLDNIMHRRTYNASMEDSLAKINEAIKSGKFVLPDDPEELGFYRKMILELLGKYTDPNMFQVSGFIEMGFSEIGSNSQRDYISLWSMIRTVLGRHAKFLFGEMETNTDESNGGR
ncbi:hypothetical protein KKF04_03140, partial [Patescibacteria group bacterium]|nr:hypothetical protein [Patescibacteria group bacterium]